MSSECILSHELSKKIFKFSRFRFSYTESTKFPSIFFIPVIFSKTQEKYKEIFYKNIFDCTREYRKKMEKCVALVIHFFKVVLGCFEYFLNFRSSSIFTTTKKQRNFSFYRKL